MNTQPTKKPNPGSREAGEMGCNCPVMDNGYGKGYLGGVPDPFTGENVFVIREDCPLHGTAKNESEPTQ